MHGPDPRHYIAYMHGVAGHGIPAHSPHRHEGRVTIGAMYRPGAYRRTGLVILPTTSLILVVKEIRAAQTLEFYCVIVILSCFHRQKCVTTIEIWLWKVKWGNRKWIKFNKYFCRDEWWEWCTIRCQFSGRKYSNWNKCRVQINENHCAIIN